PGGGGAFGQQPGATGGGATGSGFIQADATTNSLIITAPDAIYRNLRAVIDQLDVRRAQVYIEALVVEVDTTKDANFGVQWVGLTGDSTSNYRIGGLQSFSTGGNNIVNLAAAKAAGIGALAPLAPTGLSIGLFHQVAGQLGLGAVVRALQSDTSANILSTPNLITLDNELATIKVGQNVPIVTGSFTTSSSGANNPFQTIDRKDVGLVLKVRPQISEGGTIKLAIYHENSSVVQSSINSSQGVITNIRAFESNVIADDGQIIVLGGLIEDSSNENEERVHGLASIPVIGNLFKFRSRGRTKTNLMVFLRPIVLKGRDDSNQISLDRYDYLRAAGNAALPPPSVLLENLGGPVPPALDANGQPIGSNVLARMPEKPAEQPSQLAPAMQGLHPVHQAQPVHELNPAQQAQPVQVQPVQEVRPGATNQR
ncbi:type II secretion system protein GspD, partial [Massilia horti]